MKKLILLILVGSLLLITATSCLQNDKTEQTTPNNTTKDTMPSQNNQNNSPDVNLGELLDKTSKLVVTLIDYLEEYRIQVELPPLSLSNQINQIKNGSKPFHTVFDSSDYYYVCGYYTSPHELEYVDYCCPEEYTWVKYEDESQIQEYSDEMKCIVTFQINNASTITDLLSNETSVSNVQHFQIYTPIFENGVNTETALVFDETFIYLCDTNENILYHCIDTYYHELITIPCARFDNQYYVSIYLDTIGSGEIFILEKSLSKDAIIYNFGEYYDSIVSVMDTEKYYTNNGDGYIVYYGVVSLENFVERVIK